MLFDIGKFLSSFSSLPQRTGPQHPTQPPTYLPRYVANTLHTHAQMYLPKSVHVHTRTCTRTHITQHATHIHYHFSYTHIIITCSQGVRQCSLNREVPAYRYYPVRGARGLDISRALIQCQYQIPRDEGILKPSRSPVMRNIFIPN